MEVVGSDSCSKSCSGVGGSGSYQVDGATSNGGAGISGDGGGGIGGDSGGKNNKET